jgi:hypothetical protein
LRREGRGPAPCGVARLTPGIFLQRGWGRKAAALAGRGGLPRGAVSLWGAPQMWWRAARGPAPCGVARLTPGIFLQRGWGRKAVALAGRAGLPRGAGSFWGAPQMWRRAARGPAPCGVTALPRDIFAERMGPEGSLGAAVQRGAMLSQACRMSLM